MKQQDASSTRARLLCGRGVCGPLPNAPPRATLDSRHAADERGWTLPDAPTTRWPLTRVGEQAARCPANDTPRLSRSASALAHHTGRLLCWLLTRCAFLIRAPSRSDAETCISNQHASIKASARSPQASPASRRGTPSPNSIASRGLMCGSSFALEHATAPAVGVAPETCTGLLPCVVHRPCVSVRDAPAGACVPVAPSSRPAHHPGVSSRRVPACLLRGRRHWPSQPLFVSRACKEMVSGGCCLLNTPARTPFVSNARRVRRCESVS